jgi:hypothetical protein
MLLSWRGLALTLTLTLTRSLSLPGLHNGLLALRGYRIALLCEAVDDATTAGLNSRAELLNIGLAGGPYLIESRRVRSRCLLCASEWCRSRNPQDQQAGAFHIGSHRFTIRLRCSG